MTVGPVEVALLAATGIFAGAIGAMVGIGGGLVIIPMLFLVFGVPIHVAVAASLASVVATSSAAGSVYVGEGLTNMRLAMTLELATTAGAIGGGISSALLPSRALSGIFAAFVVLTCVLLLVRHQGGEERPAQDAAGLRGYEARGRLAGGYAQQEGIVEYRARRLPLGMAASFVAGNVSGLLGVGGGFIKVPAMNLGMDVPIRVAAATSNFMIGVTAAASLFVYTERGFLDPLIAAPVAVGVAVGALAGTRLSVRVPSSLLARILAVVLLVAATQMALRALGVFHAG